MLGSLRLCYRKFQNAFRKIINLFKISGKTLLTSMQYFYLYKFNVLPLSRIWIASLVNN